MRYVQLYTSTEIALLYMIHFLSVVKQVCIKQWSFNPSVRFVIMRQTQLDWILRCLIRLKGCLRGEGESWGAETGCWVFNLPSSRWHTAAQGTVKRKVSTGSDTAINTAGIKMAALSVAVLRFQYSQAKNMSCFSIQKSKPDPSPNNPCPQYDHNAESKYCRSSWTKQMVQSFFVCFISEYQETLSTKLGPKTNQDIKS